METFHCAALTPLRLPAQTCFPAPSPESLFGSKFNGLPLRLPFLPRGTILRG